MHPHKSQKYPDAPGRSRTDRTRSPAAKSGVGCALSAGPLRWFTICRPIVTEIYHPWTDHDD